MEFYILPQCPLASGLLGAVQSEEAALTELPPGSLLLVSVHSKVRPGCLSKYKLPLLDSDLTSGALLRA